YRGPLWLAFRSLDCFRGKSDSGAKGIYQRWNGRRGNLRGSLRSRWPEAHYGDGGLGRCVARHVFLQRLGHYSDAGRPARRRAVAPALTGFVLGRTGHYFWAFAITAVVSLLGALSWAFWIGRVEPVVWASQDRGGATPG